MSATTTATHDETIAKYKEYVTTSFVAAVEPVVVERAEGATIWDADGAEYIDCFAGIAVNNAGHRHPRVIDAVKAQLDKVVHAATYVYHVPVVADAAEKIAQIAPGKLSKTFFGNSGAEGIETAAQAAYLAVLDCDFYQGYYFGRPVPESELATIILRELQQGAVTSDARATA